MKKVFGYIIVLATVCFSAMLMTSCVDEPTGPTSAVVGFWEYVDDSEHCIIFGNKGDYIDVYRQQAGQRHGTINKSGIYFYNGTEIDFVNPLSKDTEMYYIVLKDGQMTLTHSITGEQYILKSTRDNRGFLFD